MLRIFSVLSCHAVPTRVSDTSWRPPFLFAVGHEVSPSVAICSAFSSFSQLPELLNINTFTPFRIKKNPACSLRCSDLPSRSEHTHSEECVVAAFPLVGTAAQSAH